MVKKDLCIVHIGMPKTGSTALQNSLFSHIADERVAYAALPIANHSGIIYSMFSSSPEKHNLHLNSKHSEEDIEVYNANNKALLVEGFRNHSTSIEIISGEDIYHLGQDENALHRMKAFLEENFKQIIIVGYVRPPKSFMESAFQQLVKYHHLSHFDFPLFYPHYTIKLENFDRVFGRENVHLWKFDPKSFPHGDITLDFCGRLEIKTDVQHALRANDSISQEAIALLFAHHKYGHNYDFGIQNTPLSYRLVESVATIGKGKFKFSKIFTDSILETYKADLVWMEERMDVSLEEFSSELESDIGSEEDLLNFSDETIEALKNLIGEEDLPQEILGTSPQEVAKLVDALKLKLAKELGVNEMPKELTLDPSKPLGEENIQFYYEFFKNNHGFDEAFYGATYPDMQHMKTLNGDLLLHYLRHGEGENRRPNAEFDPKWYRETYEDVAQSGTNLLYHYVKFGKSEGRRGKSNIENGVIVGENDHLFLAGGSNAVLRYYNEANFFSDDICSQWRDLLYSRNERLAKMGIKYIHLFAPDKISVYPEYALQKFNHFDAHPINKLFSHHVKDIDIYAINPLESFKEAKKEHLLYWKTDTHWSFWGCYEAFLLLLSRLNVSLPTRFHDHSVEQISRVWGLAGMINAPAEMSEMHFFMKTAKRVYANELVEHKEANNLNNNGGLHIGSSVIFQNTSSDIVPQKIVIFGDSFCEYRPAYLTAMFAEVFAEVHFVWSTSLDYEYIDRVKPDIVISEIAERFMNRVPDDAFILSRYVEEKMVTLV
jgi:hypothetical protein